jgi:hypothetical protein
LTSATPREAPELGLVDHDLGKHMRNPEVGRRPIHLRRSDGVPILYEGSLHAISGEPGCGKSWIALATAKSIIDTGHGVVVLDYESSPQRVASRLLALGADPDLVSAQLSYLTPLGLFGLAELDHLRGLVQGGSALVVVDSVSEAMAAAGLDENLAGDVLGWAESTVRPLARDGATVLLIDHVTKSQGDRGRWARGSGAKLALIDGVAFALTATKGFSRQGSGSASLVVAKDRDGCVGAVGDTVAHVTFEVRRAGDAVRVRLDPPDGAQ